jgi:hypothetical protein
VGLVLWSFEKALKILVEQTVKIRRKSLIAYSKKKIEKSSPLRQTEKNLLESQKFLSILLNFFGYFSVFKSRRHIYRQGGEPYERSHIT